MQDLARFLNLLSYVFTNTNLIKKKYYSSFRKFMLKRPPHMKVLQKKRKLKNNINFRFQKNYVNRRDYSAMVVE